MGADRVVTACTVTALSCSTDHVFRVREACADDLASSPWLVSSTVRTSKSGQPPQPTIEKRI